MFISYIKDVFIINSSAVFYRRAANLIGAIVYKSWRLNRFCGFKIDTAKAYIFTAPELSKYIYQRTVITLQPVIMVSQVRQISLRHCPEKTFFILIEHFHQNLVYFLRQALGVCFLF